MSNKTNSPGSMYVNTGPVPYDHVPRCYVCGFVFGVDWEIGIISPNRKRRPCLGVYDANELINQTFWAMKPWWSFYRMILHDPKNSLCQISGVAFYHLETYNEFAVPWDKEKGIIGYEATKDKVNLATPVAADEHPKAKFDAYNSGLVGYPIHGRCWEILCNHRVAATAENDLERLLLVLRQKHREWKYGIIVQEPKEELMETDDPGNINLIRSIIKRARRRTAARFKTKGPRQCRSRLSYFPIELLYRTLDLLPPPDVKNVQRSLWIYLGDAYWRSRIAMDFFHEVKAIMEETLDWEYLCLELDYSLRTSRFDGLACRRYLFERLDEVQDALDKAKV